MKMRELIQLKVNIIDFRRKCVFNRPLGNSSFGLTYLCSGNTSTLKTSKKLPVDI